jgi:Outer membrane protein Omp28/FlgD Ig-like domain
MHLKRILISLPLVLIFSIISQAQVSRKVLIEEFTGTWCPNCPDGHAELRAIDIANPNKVITVGFHNRDAYSNPYQLAVETNFAITGFPSASIDRAFFSTLRPFVLGRNYWAPAVANRLTKTSPVEIKIATTFNRLKNEVSVKVTANFKAAVNDIVKLNCVLLEDSIVGIQTGGSSPYIHRDVCRGALTTDPWGDDINTSAIAAGQTIVRSFTYPVEAGIDINKMRIVASIGNKKAATASTSGYDILNVEDIHVDPNIATATVSPQFDNFEVTCTPNPFNVMTSVGFTLPKSTKVIAYVTDIMGTIVHQLTNENRDAGLHGVYWAGTDNNYNELPNGLYFINIITDEARATKAVILQK